MSCLGFSANSAYAFNSFSNIKVTSACRQVVLGSHILSRASSYFTFILLNQIGVFDCWLVSRARHSLAGYFPLCLFLKPVGTDAPRLCTLPEKAGADEATFRATKDARELHGHGSDHPPPTSSSTDPCRQCKRTSLLRHTCLTLMTRLEYKPKEDVTCKYCVT